MHVNRVKACTLERRSHFDVRVHPLLTQYRHFRTRTGRNIRCGDIVINIKGQLRAKARIGIVGFRIVLLIGTLRVITQTLHLPGGFGPPDAKRRATFAEDGLTVGFDNKTIARDGLTQVMYAIAQTVLRQQCFHRLAIRCANLNHRAKFFVEQRRQTIVAQCGDIRLHPTVTGKGHFRQRHQQAAIGTVVISEQFTLHHQRLHRVVEALQLRDVTHICRRIAKLAVYLRQRRRAQRVVATAQVDQQQRVVFSRKLRGDGMTHIFHASKSGNHQRQRRGHFALFVAFLPAGFHRHRVFTHRNRQTQRRTEFFTDRFHRFV